jgi:hypothetical protein
VIEEDLSEDIWALIPFSCEKLKIFQLYAGLGHTFLFRSNDKNFRHYHCEGGFLINVDLR